MELFHWDIETACGFPNWETFKLEDERGSKLFGCLFFNKRRFLKRFNY